MKWSVRERSDRITKRNDFFFFSLFLFLLSLFIFLRQAKRSVKQPWAASAKSGCNFSLQTLCVRAVASPNEVVHTKAQRRSAVCTYVENTRGWHGFLFFVCSQMLVRLNCALTSMKCRTKTMTAAFSAAAQQPRSRVRIAGEPIYSGDGCGFVWDLNFIFCLRT